MSKRLLIVGASGLVGSALLKEAKTRNHKAIGTYFGNLTGELIKLDYGDYKEVNKILNDFLPEVILCPAGKVNVDWIEENPQEAWNNNVAKLNVLFECAAKQNIFVVFYSTDYIFDGKDGPYGEDAIPNPINIYGMHKLVNEIMLKTFLPKKHLIIRTTWVFGQEMQKKNFVYAVIKNLSSRKEMNIPSDLSATPTYVKDLSRCTLELVEKELSGVFNVVGSECVSRFDFAKSIASVFNLNESLLKPVKYASMRLPANRPLHTGLKNDKVNKALNPEWTPLKEALKETKLEIEGVVYELK